MFRGQNHNPPRTSTLVSSLQQALTTYCWMYYSYPLPPTPFLRWGSKVHHLQSLLTTSFYYPLTQAASKASNLNASSIVPSLLMEQFNISKEKSNNWSGLFLWIHDWRFQCIINTSWLSQDMSFKWTAITSTLFHTTFSSHTFFFYLGQFTFMEDYNIYLIK